MAPLLLLAGLGFAGDLLIENARLWDGTGAPPREGVSILVQDGRITAIGAPPEDRTGLEVVDVAGAMVIPGLIDTHVHLVSNPGFAWRQDSEAERQDQLRQAMAAYLACGVTTIFDPGTYLPYSGEVAAWREAGAPGPEHHHVGFALSPKGGYLDGAFPGYPSIVDEADLKRIMDENVASGAVAFKAVIESGFVSSSWPVFDAGQREAIAREAAARGKPLYIHAVGPDELDLALEMRPYGLVHTPEHLKSGQLDRLKALNPWVSSTLATEDIPLYGIYPERLQAPLLRLVVPPAQLETAEAPDIFLRYRQAVARVILPRARYLHGVAARTLGRESFVQRRIQRMADILRALKDAGLRIAMGSDAGNWPVFPYLFHGPSTLREIELLGRASFTPEEALIASTRSPAEMLGVADRVGTVEVGKEADLVILREDPLQDLSALWSVGWTVADGEIRTPEGWMAEGRRAHNPLP